MTSSLKVTNVAVCVTLGRSMSRPAKNSHINSHILLKPGVRLFYFAIYQSAFLKISTSSKQKYKYKYMR